MYFTVEYQYSAVQYATYTVPYITVYAVQYSVKVYRTLCKVQCLVVCVCCLSGCGKFDSCDTISTHWIELSGTQFVTVGYSNPP